MAELGSGVLTLQDYRSTLTPDGKSIDALIEMLLVDDGFLKDFPLKEGNMTAGNSTMIQTGIPTVTWRRYNESVQPSAGKRVQVVDTCGMAETFMSCDKALADLGGLTSQFLATEARDHIIGMSNDVQKYMFYGDSKLYPEQPLGLAPRYPYKDSPNVVDFGGTGSNLTSLWFCTWGDMTGFGFYPKGSKAGLQHIDHGSQVETDSSGGKIVRYNQQFKWDIGLSIRNWRYFVRCCNIESQGITGTGTNNVFDKTTLLIKAKNLIPAAKLGRTVAYCNGDVLTQLEAVAFNRTNPNITTLPDVLGVPITRIGGIPVIRCDSIMSTEDALVATP